jgi:glycine dehydrogenase
MYCIPRYYEILFLANIGSFFHYKTGINFRFRFLLSDKLHPQTIACVQTRARPFGVKVEVVDIMKADLSRKDVGGVIFQYPDTEGSVCDFTKLVTEAK